MATISSNGTGGGNWSVTTSWVGAVVPVIGDKVNILLGDTITVGGVVGGGDDTSTAINVSGVLKASRTANSDLTVRGELVISGVGSDFDYGTLTSPIPDTVTAILRLNDSAVLTSGKWGLNCAVDAGYHVYGAGKKTNTYLLTQLLVGGNTFTVNDATGWKVGDRLILATTTPFTPVDTKYDNLLIQSIVGNVITTTAAALYQHEINGRVGNFTRNVQITSLSTGKFGYQRLYSTATTPLNSREIQNVELSYLGVGGAVKINAALGIETASSTVNPYTSVGNIAVYNVGNTGIDFFSNRANIKLTDCAIIAIGHYGAQIRQGSIVEFDGVVTYGAANGLTSSYSQGGMSCVFNNCIWVGCSANALNMSSAQGYIYNNCTMSSSNFAVAPIWGATNTFNNCILGYKNGLYDGSNRYSFYATNGALTTTVMNDCIFNNTTGIVSNILNAADGYKIYISNKNGDPALQEIYTPTGGFLRDNVTFRSGVASLQAQPNSTTIPLSNSWQVFAPTGQPVVVSGYLRKNTSYGSATLPKVTLSGLGITPSIFTMTDVNDTWVQFVVMGTQTTGTDGILTLTAEFQSGAAGANAWIDGIVAPATIPVNSGNMGYWAGGQPAQLLSSNFTSPDDVWDKLSSDVTLTGSMGELIKTTEEKVDDNQALIIAT